MPPLFYCFNTMQDAHIPAGFRLLPDEAAFNLWTITSNADPYMIVTDFKQMPTLLRTYACTDISNFRYTDSRSTASGFKDKSNAQEL